jgi:glycerol uptake facilitator protein
MGHLTGMQILRNSILKLFFEALGTAFLTLTFNSTQKLGFAQNQTALLLVLWVMSIFGMKISGAHYNPAISLSFCLRKDVGSFPRILAVAYIFAQIAGAFLGALISWFLYVNGTQVTSGLIYPVPYYDIDAKEFNTGKSRFAAIIAEPLGTFFVAFFYLTQTEEKTVFSKEKAINCFIIASAYIGSRSMLSANTFTASGAVLNPAIAIGTSFTQLFDRGTDGFQDVWIYGLLPFIGAVLAVLFHEFVFKKTHEVLAENDGNESDDNDTLLDK